MSEDLKAMRFFRPTPTDEFLANPHKGCCTFQRFNGDDLIPGLDWTKHEQGPLQFQEKEISRYESGFVDGYLPTTVAYCRWFWNVLEPEQGRYDFSMIDKSLAVCKRRNQTLAVRLMPFGVITYGQPALPEWYEKTGAPMQPFRDWNKKVPVYESKEYFELFGNLIKEFGKRYDSDPLLESIDVAYLGPWGEGGGECSQETCDRFAELWKQAFPNTIKLSLVAARLGDQFKAGMQKGFGWRADCFGDLRQSSLSSMQLDEGRNHMFNVYPKRVIEAGASDAWRKMPVHLEVGYVPMTWYYKNFDIDFIIQQGLKYHMTYFMPKSSRLPEKWMDKLAVFCRNIGYRFTFRQAVLPRSVKPNAMFNLDAWIENIGVAPLYKKYDFAVRLKQGKYEDIIISDGIDVRTWLPGDICFEKQIQLNSGFGLGVVEVSTGLIDSTSKEVKVCFANKERYPDRWLLLGYIEVNT